MPFNQRIQSELVARVNAGLDRKLTVLEGGNQSTFTLRQPGSVKYTTGSTEYTTGSDKYNDNLNRVEKHYVNFSSNDYLGLASSSELAQAWQQGIDKYGVGSGASPLVTGFSPAHQALEYTLCDWLGYSRAVVFSSGFSANQAVLFSLLQKDDLLLQDKLNHASLLEAGKLSPAQMRRFKHNDIEQLRHLLLSRKPQLVVTEGVFSMDGDQAPLNRINQAVNQSNAWLMVDDAHGIGVLGKNGAGSCQLAGIKPQLLVVTFGKAFGLSGAVVLCNASTGDYLTQFARHHVYSTALPPSQAYALNHAATMLRTQQWRRDKLAELYHAYDKGLNGLAGFVATNTPIKPFICGDVERTCRLANQLKASGNWVTAIRPPTVAKQTSRIRITLTANHTVQQVNHLTHSINMLAN
ncbi:8-amino-7-oxononanoate synthase [Vibrio sp. MA40-2]|uniref:8-amino-7-oxononanoate synthase n=1 Tax=Vibrio sp. MA40-2 TaxID=3391828 RepID=UPI0039A7490D